MAGTMLRAVRDEMMRIEEAGLNSHRFVTVALRCDTIDEVRALGTIWLTEATW